MVVGVEDSVVKVQTRMLFLHNSFRRFCFPIFITFSNVNEPFSIGSEFLVSIQFCHIRRLYISLFMLSYCNSFLLSLFCTLILNYC